MMEARNQHCPSTCCGYSTITAESLTGSVGHASYQPNRYRETSSQICGLQPPPINSRSIYYRRPTKDLRNDLHQLCDVRRTRNSTVSSNGVGATRFDNYAVAYLGGVLWPATILHPVYQITGPTG